MILYIESTIDNSVDVIMFYKFRDLEMTLFDRELTL